MAPVRSAAGATEYFAKDNYYTTKDATEASRWAGAGAARLGLTGAPTPDAFMSVLVGELPDGVGAKDFAQGRHLHVQRCFLDYHLRPHTVEQFVLGDEVSGAIDERNQQIECARAQ